MSFTDIFIKRPVLASVVSLLILLIGAQAGFQLPIRQYPELSKTTITVTTVYPGANADLIQGFITVPIQQAVASTEGIDTPGRDLHPECQHRHPQSEARRRPDRAMTDVLSKVAQVGRHPAACRNYKTLIVTSRPAKGYALMLLCRSQRSVMDLVADNRLPDARGAAAAPDHRRRRQCPDPRRPDLCHACLARPRAHGWAKRHPNEVRAAFAANNFTSAPGQMKGDFVEDFTIDAQTSLESAQAFGSWWSPSVAIR